MLAVVVPGSKVRADPVTDMAGFTKSGAKRALAATDLFLSADTGAEAFVRGLVEGIVFMQGAVFSDLLRNGGGIFPNGVRDFPERSLGVQTFFDENTVVLCQVFIAARN